MERKIGEIFIYKNKTYQVMEVEVDEECKGCAFEFSSCCTSFLGDCSPTHRTDGASVIFKEINNMENNQLIINIPEGMEVDVEHSDLSKGIIKFRNNNITIEDIYENQGKDTFITNIVNNNTRTYNKISAIATLLDIANYYNKGWKPDFNNKTTYKYVIQYNGIENKHTHYSVDYDVCLNRCCVYFKNQENAQSVIDNPNFRDILDTIYKD